MVKAKISVIVPVYNVEKYLRRCLESIINQSFADIEIICVNDGSTDGSKAVLEEYAAKDRRIIVLNKPNGGLSSARNAGLELAGSEYIGFVDSDDWIESSTYELAYNAMQDADLVCYYASIDVEGSENEFTEQTRQYHAVKRAGLKKITKRLMLDTAVTAWSKLYKKSIVDKYGLRFPEGLYFEDNEFFFKYIVMCEKVFFIDKKLYHYIQRDNSIMGMKYRKSSEHLTDHLSVFFNIYSFYRDEGLLPAYAYVMQVLFGRCLYEDYTYTERKDEVVAFAEAIAEKIDLDLVKLPIDESENQMLRIIQEVCG